MPLRITLKPQERLLINGALIRNAGKNANFIIETQCKFLRESEILSEADVDTPCKELVHLAQLIYVSDHPETLTERFVARALDVIKVAPSTRSFIISMMHDIEEAQHYKAIKTGKELVSYESSLIERTSN